MNVLSITAINYRSWAELDVELPLGATAIVGENGAGKSSIVGAIDYALFAGRGEGARLVRRGCDHMTVVVTVEHGGVPYYVSRGVAKGKPRLEFGVVGGPDLTLESVDATAARLVETFGVTREAFRASALLLQGDAAAWTEADPADRKRVLADVLGLSTWDRLSELVKRDRQTAEEELARSRRAAQEAEELEARLVALATQIAEARELEDAARSELEPLELAEANARQALEDALVSSGRIAAHAAALRELAAAQTELENAERYRADADDHAARLREALANSAGLEELGEERDARATLERAAALQARELEIAITDAARLEEAYRAVVDRNAARELLTCPTCGQALHGDAADQAQATLDEAARIAADELDLAETRVAKLKAELPRPDPDALVRAEAAFGRAQRWAATAYELRRTTRPAEELEAAVAGAQTRIDAARRMVERNPPPPAGGLLEAEARENLGRVVAAKRERSDSANRYGRDVAGLEASYRTAQERLSELEPARAGVGEAQDRVVLLEALHGAYGRNGVPALIVEQRAVPLLEQHANRILAEWESPMRVELRTQRATKSGDLRETLDILVHTDGREAEYRDFSGGERTRLNVALRVALALLLGGVGTLIVDEPEYLDPDGNDRLAGILRGLALERFDRVLLVSPKQDLGDALDQTLVIVKDDAGESRIDTPAA